MSQLNLENREFIKYNLIRKLELAANGHMTILAAEYAEHQLCAIVNMDEKDARHLQPFIKHVREYVLANFMLQITVGIGKQVSCHQDIHHSFRTAVQAMKYHFFHADQAFFHADIWQARDQSTAQIPEEKLLRLATALRAGKLESVQDVLHDFVHDSRSNDYSAAHCHARWKEIKQVFQMYLQEIRHPDPRDYHACIDVIVHIEQGVEQMMLAIEEVYDRMDERVNRKNHELVVVTKQYIEDHLQAPISLESAAEHVNMSAKYLSRLFKEETGLNFSEYVNAQRLEQAEHLLLNYDMTVEQVSTHVGFNSSAYFIKKFKEAYGVTPRMYKHYSLTSPDWQLNS